MNKFIFKLAKANKKYPNEIYKKMISRSNLLSKKMPLYLFKEAFHSSKTPPEYRAILLSSLYHDKPDYKSLIRRSPNVSNDLVNMSFKIIEDSSGKKAFGLYGFRGYKKHAFEGFIPRKPQRIALSPDAKKQIHNWFPKALRQRLLTTALGTGKMQFQKIALFAENLTRCLFDIALITRDFVFLNDPRRIYNLSPEKSLVKEWEEAFFTGYFAESARIFKKDLEHMMMEFDKYSPYLERMGFDLTRVRETFNVVYDNLSFYKNNNYNNNTQAEEDALYEIHDNTGAFVRSLVEIAGRIEDLDENSPEIYEFGRLEVLPDYVPYRSNSSTIRRSLEGVDEGLTFNLKQITGQLNG